MRKSDLTAVLAAFATVSSAGAAQAYCRTSSCQEGQQHTAQVCTPAMAGDCGTVLFWAQPCVGWSLQTDASTQVTLAQMATIVDTAFHTWMNAPCAGGGTPRIQVTEAASVVCKKHEYNKDKGNANVFLFHDDAWPYAGASSTLALTTVTYDLETGEIYDADMEINSANNHLTTDDTNVDFDLLSIMTHETGHFLGLAHSPIAEATMFPSYGEHSISLRQLSDDDIQGICAIYPPGPIPSDCDATPRHGFSPLCGDDQPEILEPMLTGGCDCTSTPSGTGQTGMATALGVLALAAQRAHAKRRQRG